MAVVNGVTAAVVAGNLRRLRRRGAGFDPGR
jgi:hypothetical protein